MAEIRHIRIEDWMGNKYLPEGTGGGGAGGEVVKPEIDPENPGDPHDPNDPKDKTEGTEVADPEANGGTAIKIVSGNTPQTIFCTDIAGVPFGKITVNMRIKSNLDKSDMELIQVNTYYVDYTSTEFRIKACDSIRLTANAFIPANKYVNVCTTTDFEGIATKNYALRVEVICLPNTGGIFYFDQLTVGLQMPDEYKLSDHMRVEDKCIIVDPDEKSVYVAGDTVVVP